jgi:CheY-like chemotaxis protein
MRNETSSRDFDDLKVMLVEPDEYNATIFKGVAGSIGIHQIAEYTNPKSALANIRLSGAPDILFVKFGEKQSQPLQLCRLIRDRESFPHPFMPIVAIMERATMASVTAVRDAGVDEFLACPYSPKSLGERVRSIVYDRRGFVAVPEYFGPDRRRGAMAKWLGSDRRSEPSELINPITEEMYIG